MIIDIQIPEAAKLLWELFESLPEASKPLFAPKVDVMASKFEHPSLNGAVVFTLGSDDTFQTSSTF